jgi:hypothetical protein
MLTVGGSAFELHDVEYSRFVPLRIPERVITECSIMKTGVVCAGGMTPTGCTACPCAGLINVTRWKHVAGKES